MIILESVYIWQRRRGFDYIRVSLQREEESLWRISILLYEVRFTSGYVGVTSLGSDIHTVITSWCLSFKINEQELNEWFTKTNIIENADRYWRGQKCFSFFFIISKLHQKFWKFFKEFVSWIWLKLFHQIIQIGIKINGFVVLSQIFSFYIQCKGHLQAEHIEWSMNVCDCKKLLQWTLLQWWTYEQKWETK